MQDSVYVSKIFPSPLRETLVKEKPYGRHRIPWSFPCQLESSLFSIYLPHGLVGRSVRNSQSQSVTYYLVTQLVSHCNHSHCQSGGQLSYHLLNNKLYQSASLSLSHCLKSSSKLNRETNRPRVCLWWPSANISRHVPEAKELYQTVFGQVHSFIARHSCGFHQLRFW